MFQKSAVYWLDVEVLEDTGEDASIDTLITALSHYEGELLPGFYEEWMVLEREHLHSLFEHHMARLMSLLQEEKRRLAYVEVREAKFDEAVRLFSECLELNRQLDHEHGMVACLAGFAAIHLARRDFEKAAILCGCVENRLARSVVHFYSPVRRIRALARCIAAGTG